MLAVRSALAVLIAVVLAWPVPAAAQQPPQAQPFVLSVADLGPDWVVVPNTALVEPNQIDELLGSVSSVNVLYENAIDYTPPRQLRFEVLAFKGPRAAEEYAIAMEYNLSGFIPAAPIVGLGDGLAVRTSFSSQQSSRVGYTFRVGSASANVVASGGAGVDERVLDSQAKQWALAQEERLRQLLLPPAVQVLGPPDLVDLGTLGGSISEATGINEDGQVVGAAQTAGGEQHALVWTGDQMLDLGGLGGATSKANSINTVGQIVGSAETEAGQTHAFLWDSGVMHDLGTLGEYKKSDALDVNDHGQVVGYARADPRDHMVRARTFRAFEFDNDTTRDLGILEDPNSFASAINADGSVAGWAEVSKYHLPGFIESEHLVVWDGDAPSDLGTLPGFELMKPSRINSMGQIAGLATNAGPYQPSHAFLYANGTLLDLGSLAGEKSSSQAHGLNDRGKVVGWFNTPTGVRHAAVWEDGQLVDLNTLLPSESAWVLTEARAINNANQVAGVGFFGGGPHAFLWQLPDD